MTNKETKSNTKNLSKNKKKKIIEKGYNPTQTVDSRNDRGKDSVQISEPQEEGYNPNSLIRSRRNQKTKKSSNSKEE